MSHKPLPKVEIDWCEAHAIRNNRPCKTAAHLMCSDLIEFTIGPKTDLIGDYVVTDRKGQVFGLERKTTSDCYGSILDGRIYGQLCQLVERFGDRAIFLLEEGYVSPKIGVPAWKVKEAVYSFLSHRSLLMPTWITTGPEHSAREIIELARCEIKDSLRGRGIVVKKVGDIG